MQRFEVSGMTCGHCVRAVTEAIQSVDATARVEVDLTAGSVTVRDGTASPDQVSQAIEAEGYRARLLAA
ncbi:MAG TPA: heavy-metal-associated domain-containing protein [Acetobacteraceae bacterium]